MGTILSIVTAALAVVLIAVPFGTHFYVLAGLIVLLWAAALTRPNPTWFMAAGLLTAFVGLAIAPFVPPRTFLRELRNAAKDGDGEAESLVGFYEAMNDWSTLLEIGLVLVILAALVVGARRAMDGAHQFLFDASEGLGAFAVKCGRLASWLFIPMMIIIAYDVTQRKYLEFSPGFADSALFKTLTSTKLQEMEWHLHAILFLMCLGFAYVKDAHVRIELVRDRMQPRTRVWIELLGATLFLAPYCFLIYAYGYDFARKAFEINEVSAALTGLPYRWIIKSFLPIGFTVLGLAAFSVWLKCFVYLFGPPDLKDKASYYAGTHHADIPEDVAAAGAADGR